MKFMGFHPGGSAIPITKGDSVDEVEGNLLDHLSDDDRELESWEQVKELGYRIRPVTDDGSPLCCWRMHGPRLSCSCECHREVSIDA